MTLPELYASVAPAAGHAADSWPMALGAFLGALSSHHLNRRQLKRLVRGLDRRLGRVERFLFAHFKLPPLGRGP